MKIVIGQDQIVETIKNSVLEMVPLFADMNLTHEVSENVKGEIEISFAITDLNTTAAEPKKEKPKAEPKAKGPAFKKNSKPAKEEVEKEDDQPIQEEPIEEEEIEPAKSAEPKKSIFDKAKAKESEGPTDGAAGAGSVEQPIQEEPTAERKKPLFGNMKK